MKITETIERECCSVKDLIPYRGCMEDGVKKLSPHFCVHCGQIWVSVMRMGPAGSSESEVEKIRIKTSCF